MYKYMLLYNYMFSFLGIDWHKIINTVINSLFFSLLQYVSEGSHFVMASSMWMNIFKMIAYFLITTAAMQMRCSESTKLGAMSSQCVEKAHHKNNFIVRVGHDMIQL